MANYIKKIDFPEEIKNNATIIFTLDNGEAVHGIFVYTPNGFFITAWSLFDKIGLKNVMDFFTKVVGPENVSYGSWPYVKGEDNMHKILNALKDFRADRIPEDKKVIINDDEKKPFTLSVKNKRSTTLNFKL